MLQFALFGAGRIGRMHADNLGRNPRARLAQVYDVNGDAAAQTAAQHGARSASSVEEALGDGDVGAVLIASSTDTHVELITAAVAAGKAVLCEKPIDLDIGRVEGCRNVVENSGLPVQIGFNRRYDPTHRAVQRAVRDGEVGAVEQVVITSRDPSPAPVEYLRVSGGLFRDMMIHDFDLARFMLGEEPVEISAFGSVMVDPTLADMGDVDTAMVLMRTPSGALCHISNSRRAVYGYDQRVEVFGARGMVRSDNRRATDIERYTGAGTATRDPLMPFFIERYPEAYVDELDDFIDAVEQGREPSVSFEDGRRALILADAANEALRTGRNVEVRY